MTSPPPASWTITPDHALRTKDGGRTLIGGSPIGVIRLSDSGSTIAASLFNGGSVGAEPLRADLARRLIDRGMAHPVPHGDGPSTSDLTVIIPVYGDQPGLERTLNFLARVALTVIVDDGSHTPMVVPPDLSRSPVTLIRNDENLGPAGSRNAGLSHATTSLVLFLDAGVVIDADALSGLLDHLGDDDVVAAGPRVLARPSISRADDDRFGGPDNLNLSTLDRYEADHSPLDLGPHASPVRPGASVSYVPTACLLVRRSALHDVGPFDPSLRYGEDVDLVWRLRTVGSVRYVPGIEVSHPSRATVGQFVAQRISYGSAAGPLGRRHGAAAAPLRSSGWTLAILGLALGGRYVPAALLHAGTTRALVSKLGTLSDPLAEATRLTTTGNLWAARTVARSGVRTWWPVMTIGLALPFTRALALRWLTWVVIERAVTERESDPRLLAMGLIDDLSYGSGVWIGALRSRSLAALCPATNNQSTSGRFTIKSSNWTTSRVSTLRSRISALRSS